MRAGRAVSGAGVSIDTFLACFPDEATCLAYVFHTRHGAYPKCGACGRSARFRTFRGGPGLTSTCCHSYRSATGGTILARTNVKVRPWFYALLLYADATAGMSHNVLRRLLGLTTSAADRLADGLRTHMALSADQSPLGGRGSFVYIDECRIWFGRQRQYAIVLGLSDGQRCLLRIIPNRKAATMLPIIAGLVRAGSIVVTDGHPGYRRLNRLGFTHSIVRHCHKEWVNEGGNDTGRIESVWRICRRLLQGRAALVSEANLWKFLGEIMYRHSHRADPADAWWRLIGRFPFIDDGTLEAARRQIDLRAAAQVAQDGDRLSHPEREDRSVLRSAAARRSRR